MEEQGTDAPSSVDGTGPSVGGNDGGGFSDDAAAANQSVTQGYSNNYGLASFGPDTYSQVDAMKGALGITPTNPFGYKGFFSKNFGIDPEDIDYSNQYSGSVGGAQNAMNQIAGLNLGVSQNPNNTPGIMGFDPNQAPNQPRSGIQKGFGSLFGRPPPAFLLSGNQSLGTMADIASFGLTGGSSAQSKDAYDAITSLAPDMFNDVTNAVKDALSFNDTKGKAGTVDSTGTVNSVATGPTGTYSQPSVGIESLGLMGKDKSQDALDAVSNMFSSKGYNTVNTSGNLSKKGAKDTKNNLAIDNSIYGD